MLSLAWTHIWVDDVIICFTPTMCCRDDLCWCVGKVSLCLWLRSELVIMAINHYLGCKIYLWLVYVVIYYFLFRPIDLGPAQARDFMVHQGNVYAIAPILMHFKCIFGDIKLLMRYCIPNATLCLRTWTIYAILMQF